MTSPMKDGDHVIPLPELSTCPVRYGNSGIVHAGICSVADGLSLFQDDWFGFLVAFEFALLVRFALASGIL